MQIHPLIDPSALRQDGSKPLTADWDAGAYKITAEQLASDVAIGTAPLVITSTTLVANLNADYWDNKQFADYLNQAVKTDSSPTFVTGTFTDLVVDTNLIKTNSATNCVGINVTNPSHALEVIGEVFTRGKSGNGGAAPEFFNISGGQGDENFAGGDFSITCGAGGEADGDVGGAGGSGSIKAGDGGIGSADDYPGSGGILALAGGYVRFDSDARLNSSDFHVPSGSRILLTEAAQSDIAIGSFGNRSMYFEGQGSNQALTCNLFTQTGDGGDSVWHRVWAKGTVDSQTNSESLLVGYSASEVAMLIWSLASGTGTVHTDQLVLLATGNNTMSGNLDVAGTLTADTFTDGVMSVSEGSLTNIKLGSLTSNGLVTTSGDDGTLSVDTNTYLTDITGESIDDLSDVDDTDKADGRILKYNSVSGNMEYVDESTSGALDDITDVTITSVTDDEILQYDNGSSKWINQTLTDAGILAIDGSNGFSAICRSGKNSGSG